MSLWIDPRCRIDRLALIFCHFRLRLLDALVVAAGATMLLTFAVSAAERLPATNGIDTTLALTGPDGKPAWDASDRTAQENKDDPDCVKCTKHNTLGHACFIALMTWNIDASNWKDATATDQAGQKFAIEELARRFLAGATIELSGKEMTYTANAVAKYQPAFVGQILPRIDPAGYAKPAELK